ncbi:MAG: outer membrane beta-barrel family protein [Bacteroidota bacterium]|nr:outer membrane beta-barrel family protein [Bacteroidota bacterium]
MMNKFLIVLLCMVVANVQARQVITGSLTDKETSKPVEGASVELLQLPDSSTVELAKSNSEGLFMFYKADTVKTYCLRVKHLVYKTTSLRVVPKRKSMINNLGGIALEPSTYSIKEVVVNGTKVKVTELGDRTIYGIPEGIKKTSTDGLDVLRKVPAVQVDYLNEDITVNGKSNIKIEVDGITRDKEYLKRLHPSQIDKMEVITSPSGKYDADVDAVINIVTNPAMRFGLKGMVNVFALPLSSDSYIGRLNGSLDYGEEKVSYYVAANGMLHNFDYMSDMTRIAGTDELQRTSKQAIKGNNQNVNLGLIYDPNELNNLNLNVSFNNNASRVNGDAWNYNSSNAILNSIFSTSTNSKSNNNGITSSLFYKHKFNKNTQHGYEVELNYFTSLNNTNVTDFRNINYSPIDTTVLLTNPWQNEKSKTKTQTFTGQSNYTLPFDSVYSFNAGVSGNYNRYIIDNTSSQVQNKNLDYTDLRLGGYAELSRNFKKGSVKIGSRFETSHVVINSQGNSNYFSPLPYANGFLKFNDANSIKLAYSRRVIRPTAGQLNPFVSVVDSQSTSRGNINLKPAYRDNFQLTYNVKLTLKNVTVNLAPQLFYEYKTGLIQTIISQVDHTNVFESKPDNVSNGYEAGGGLSVNSQIGKVMFNSNFRYSFNHIDRYLDQIIPTNQRSWNWNSFVMFPLPWDLKFISMFNINGPVLDGQTETKASPFYFVGLVKQFKNNSSLNIIAFNPFAAKFFDNTVTLRNNSVYQRTESYMGMTTAFVIMYSYNFKIGKSIEKQKHTVEQQVEESGFKLPF